jgi:hypothetical protein
VENFRIWGRIEQTAPDQFVVIVSTVPVRFHLLLCRATVDRTLRGCRVEAEAARDELIRIAGERVRAAGDCVVDVEDD